MSSANFCNICCDTKKLMVVCPYCQFESCNTCSQKYLLDNLTPKCMSCSKQWSLEFVQNSFPVTFVNKDYKKHRENVLLEKEKALLPQTQVLLEQRKKENEIKKRIQEHYTYINALENEIKRLNGRTEEDVLKASKNMRTIPCIKSSCRGFINVTSSSKLECGLCNTKVCKDCREELKTDEHKCNPSTVETVKVLEKECKRCPKCACLIYKIAGCFDENTEILLYDGSVKKAKDIRVGDVLVGDDGLPRQVLELCDGVDKMYKVKQNNGVEYIVNSKHSLVLKSHYHKKIRQTNGTIKATYVEDNRIRSKNFSTVNEASEFLKTIRDEDDTIHITVDEYLKNVESSKSYEKQFHGFKSNGQLSSIKVEYKETAKYYGWKADGNTRFILPDLTVVKNCDQMWCIQCKTAFSWRTGNVETGVVHNPHYWEYVRTQGREDAEVRRQFGGGNPENPCDNNPRNFRFEEMLRNTNFYRRMNNMTQDLSHIARIIVHTTHVELRRYEVDMNNTTNNRDIRMKYLEKTISEESFKTIIQRRQKLNEFKQEMHQILTTFTTVSREVFTRYYYYIIELESNKRLIQCKIDMIRELSHILNFTVSSINKVAKRFTYTFPNLLKFSVFDIINKHIIHLARKIEEETKIVVKLEHMPDSNIYDKQLVKFNKEMKEEKMKEEKKKEEMKTTYKRRNESSDEEDSETEDDEKQPVTRPTRNVPIIISDDEEDSDEKQPLSARLAQNIDHIIISDDEEDIPLAKLKKK